MRLRIFALALVVTLAAAAPAAAKPILGFNDAPQTFIEHAAAVEAAGATLARVPVNWAMTESIAPSLLRWAELDQTVSALRTHQVTPMFAIFSAPKSAAGGCEPEPDPPATCGVAPATPTPTCSSRSRCWSATRARWCRPGTSRTSRCSGG